MGEAAEPRRIRTVVVDDEALARRWVKEQLQADPEIDFVGEAADGFKALLAIEKLSPDLVFLDVQMPGVDGFGVLEMLGQGTVPAVVFITAFDHYAVRAFDVNAVDYVMKPFGRERFKKALDKVKARLTTPAAEQTPAAPLSGLLTHLRGSGRYPEWLLVKSEDRSLFVETARIDWIEAARNSVLLHVGAKKHAFTATMKSLEESLDPAVFLRIHRSTIVNIRRVRELQPWFNGEYKVLLEDGLELTLSANYRSNLARFRRLSS